MECRKVKYASRKMADEDIARIRKKSKRERIPIRSYQCTICPGKPWHLTSKEDIFKAKPTEAKNTDMDQKKLDALSEEIRSLREENTILKNADSKEARHQAKIDARVKQLNDRLAKEGKTISMLRKSNSELITRIVQLEKQIQKQSIVGIT